MLRSSGIATEGGQGRQSIFLFAKKWEKFAKTQEELGKTQEKRKIWEEMAKSGRFFHLAPPERERAGYATFRILCASCTNNSVLHSQ